MNEASSSSSALLRPALARQVDLVCTRFEVAWKDGGRPRIEDFLGDAAEPERSALLHELVLLDAHYRRNQGERPAAGDYEVRFPADAARIRGAFAAEFPAENSATDGERARGLLTDPYGSGSDSGQVPARPPLPGQLGVAGRNELFEEIGRGGMGRVLRGCDPDLRRELAVKVLREEYRGDASAESRFVEEAQVGGQLQHPGVVPVYELGRFGDGRPFFTMKLVKGRTLADLLEERPAPAHDLTRFLTIFEQTCQALAYAHSKGVIHRDLKPSNVMVGTFGEVQVMDWGLAKVLSGRSAHDPEARTAATIIRTVRTDSTAEDDGRTGVVGTPSFMAPEQAQGAVDAADERADVFGLGAILCVILTGQPLYTAPDRAEMLRQAAAGDAAAAFGRLDGCGADRELVALCKACLAAERGGRPRDAGEVAARVGAYAAAVRERLRQAELARAAAETRAVEERKRRRVSLALAAAVLALVAVGAGSGLLVQNQAAGRRTDQARREAEQRQVIESALEKAVALRQQARWREAAAVLEQARDVLGNSGPDDLRQRLNVAEAELTLVNRLDAIRQRRATMIEGHFDYQTAEHDYAAAFQEASLAEVGDDETEVTARLHASGISGQLIAALDDWALVAQKPESRSWLLRVARRAAPDPWGDRFRDPEVWQQQQALQALADEALRDDGAMLYELSPHLLEALGWLLGGGAEAVPLLRAAQRRNPSDFWLNLDLGNALYNAKQGEEALGYYRAAVALRPDSSVSHNNLGCALHAKQDLDEAIAEYHKAIGLDPGYAPAHSNLGSALHAKQDLDEAIAEYHKAIGLDPGLAPAHNNLGAALFDTNDVDGAIAEYRQAIDLDPKFAGAHNNCGLALRAKQNLEGAIAEYRQAIAIDPKFAPPHYNLGCALFAAKNVGGAITEFRRTIDLNPKLAAAHYDLGCALRESKNVDGAIVEYHKAIDLDPKHAMTHNNLGNALSDKKDLDGAIAEYRKAIDLDPKNAYAHSNLGSALHVKQNLDGAIAEYQEALRLKEDFPEAHCNLGKAYRQQGRFADALTALKRGHELGSKNPGWPHPSGQWVRIVEQLIALDDKLAKFLKGEAEPTDAAELLALGQLCQQYKQQHSVAARFYADAFAADPQLAADLQQQHRYNAACCAALASAGKAEDAKNLPDKVVLTLRRQALRWLWADLALYAKLAERDDPKVIEALREQLGHWQKDDDLVTVRGKDAMNRLPDDERGQWRQLWQDVAVVLKKLEDNN